MPGLIGAGQAYKTQLDNQAIQLSQMAEERKQANKQLKAADDAETMQTAGLGAGLGLMAGMGSAGMGAQFGAAAGPVGALAGAAIGYAFGELL